jgi:hypothetical protein
MTAWSVFSGGVREGVERRLRGREGQFVFHNAEKSIRNVLVFVSFFLVRQSLTTWE